MDDEWDNPKSPKGHGTPVAIIAAGRESGVAPLANLLIYKHASLVSKKVATPPGPAEEKLVFRSVQPSATLYALEHMFYHIERVPAGKAVLNMSFSKFTLPFLYS